MARAFSLSGTASRRRKRCTSASLTLPAHSSSASPASPASSATDALVLRFCLQSQNTQADA